MDNRRGGAGAGGYPQAKGPNMQANPAPNRGHYGHNQYGNSAPVPQQYPNPNGPMRGGAGMRSQPNAPRGGSGNAMLANDPHAGYYEPQVGHMGGAHMGGYPATSAPTQPQRGGYGGMPNPRGGVHPAAGGQPSGQGQRMHGQMPGQYHGLPQHHQQGMQPMHGNPNQQRAPQSNNPNMGGYVGNDYRDVPQHQPRGNPPVEQGYNAPNPGMAPGPKNPQGNQQPGNKKQQRNQQQAQQPPQQQQAPPMTPTQQSGTPSVTQAPPQPENSLNSQSEIVMKKFNTLDRGTYFIDQNNKTINFVIDGEDDFLGWHDDYLINGYLLYGVVIKVTTLTSRVYLFIEKEHEIYQNFLKIEGDKIKWKNLPNPKEFQIATVSSVEKVEIYDNSEDGFEGFVCYTVNEESQLTFSNDSKAIQDWVSLQRTLLLFEPTSIKRIFLDVLHNFLHQPESTKFQGKSVAAIINPKVPGETVQFSTTPKLVQCLDGEFFVGVIALQYGKYTLLSQTKDNMENFARLVEKILDIAEELDGYVMITNLKRQYDSSQQHKTILILPNDPTLKIVRYEGTMNFEKTKDKLSKIITM